MHRKERGLRNGCKGWYFGYSHFKVGDVKYQVFSFFLQSCILEGGERYIYRGIMMKGKTKSRNVISRIFNGEDIKNSGLYSSQNYPWDVGDITCHNPNFFVAQKIILNFSQELCFYFNYRCLLDKLRIYSIIHRGDSQVKYFTDRFMLNRSLFSTVNKCSKIQISTRQNASALFGKFTITGIEAS